ncbi:MULTISPECIES: GNAT family N-acetyltransferase [Alphaproteobacteria]|uniref:GNAT family N-acetyltransferase n=1 Tax=Alphaproteobacteria TaxID=28211 RepID=UPI003266BB8D
MKANVSIQPVTAADHATWLPLWQGYQSFYDVKMPEAVSTQTWRRFLDSDEPMNAALARMDGQAIGLVQFIFHRSCWTEGDYCYLQDLFVAQSARGSGAGRRLIEHVYAQAEHRDCSRVYWLTHESNQKAILLYDRVADRSGFIQYRRSPPFTNRDGYEQ